jgi:hypothetical protein
MRREVAPPEHVDEGTVHAWLDGALSADEGARVEAHVASCATCSAVVAEAHGLVAGASRILNALDEVPGDVIPAAPPVVPDVRPIAGARSRRRFGVPARAAAALLLMAGATTVVLVRDGPSSAPSPREVGALVDAAPDARPNATAATPAAPVPSAARPEAPAAAPMPTPGASVRARAPRAPFEAMATPAPLGATDARADVSAQGAGSASAALSRAAEAPKRAMAATAAPPADLERSTVAQGAERRAGEAVATGVVSGVVTDRRGAPLPSANVVVAGTAIGATSDSTGRFVLRDVPAGDAALTARRLGFASATQRVVVPGADTAHTTLALAAAVRALSQVGVAAAAPQAGSAAKATEASGSARSTVGGCYALRRTTPWTPPTAAPPLLAPNVLLASTPTDDVVWRLARDGTLEITLSAGITAIELRLMPRGSAWIGSASARDGALRAQVELTRGTGCD